MTKRQPFCCIVPVFFHFITFLPPLIFNLFSFIINLTIEQTLFKKKKIHWIKHSGKKKKVTYFEVFE